MRKLTPLWCITAALVLARSPVVAQCEIEMFTSMASRVAVDGEFIFVGAPGFPPNGPVGKVLVYRAAGETWHLKQILTHQVFPLTPNRFGTTVVADNGVLAVGAGGDWYVHIFKLEDGVFQFQQLQVYPGIHFGRSLDIDGDILAVGATAANADGCDSSSGKVFLFRFDGRSWEEEAELVSDYCAPIPGPPSGFGASVTVANNVILVGNPGHPGPFLSTGAVFAYRQTKGRWTLEQELKPSDTSPEDMPGAHWFGYSVALDASGTTAVIGAKNNHLPGANQAGSAYVFEHDGTQWVEKAKLTANPPNAFAEFGSFVDISADGNTILVAETFFGSFQNAYFFRRTSGSPGAAEWVESLVVPGTGFSIDIDGDRAVTGGFGQISVFAGINDIDCNNNGIPDGCDIALGTSADLNNDGIPDECQALPDINGDGAVNVHDLLFLITHWGPCRDPEPSPRNCPADLDGNGVVNVFDLLLLLLLWGPVNPPPACPASDGDCCAVHGGAGCAEPNCCEAVCADDPFCCAVGWDMVCVHAARDVCDCPGPVGCGERDAGACCLPGGANNDSPGCSDAPCCGLICDFLDPFCCEVAWDESCEAWAAQVCTCPPAACTPTTNECCTGDPFTSPGCNDLDCCAAVCAFDAWCCNTSWDGLCAAIATDMCEICVEE